MIYVNDEHQQKAKEPIDVTEEGIVICFNNTHELNDPIPILAMNAGIITESNVRLTQTRVS